MDRSGAAVTVTTASLRLPAPETLNAFVDSVDEVLPDRQRRRASCGAVADEWLARGIAPGDLVILCLTNSADLLHQFFGVLTAGAVPALLPPTVTAARLQDLAETLGARAVAARRLPATSFGEQSRLTAGHLSIAMFPPRSGPVAARGELVQLTSGTSGFASGCVFDLDAVLLNARRHAAAIGQRSDDVVLVNLPLHFSYALVAQAMAALICGSRLVVGGPPFTTDGYSSALRHHRVTVSSLTPVLVHAMLARAPSGLCAPRVLTVGGDALDAGAVARLVDVRGGAETYLTYGLTQAGPRVSTLAVHREPPARWTSVGQPLPGTRVSLAPPRADGLRELRVTSDTVMKRSIGRVEGRVATEPGGRTISTGDVFDLDDGYLYFRGRLSDFISRSGGKVNLAAVRRVAASLPHVVGAATTTVRDAAGEDFDLELRIERGAAAAFDADRLLRRHLGGAEMPRQVRVQVTGDPAEGSYK